MAKTITIGDGRYFAAAGRDVLPLPSDWEMARGWAQRLLASDSHQPISGGEQFLARDALARAHTSLNHHVADGSFLSGKLMANVMLLGAFVALAHAVQKDGIDGVERMVAATIGGAGLAEQGFSAADAKALLHERS